ncbi:MAG: phage tail protein [Sphingomonas sp.]|nr:MAG: phage tail protein [Sphingomonas sp.]
MSDWYIGEIRILPYSRGAPLGWQLCDGSLLAISEYDVLFVLLGNTYGGDGQTTFAVPDLRGRAPVHQGTGRGLTTIMQASTDVGTSVAPSQFVLAAVPPGLNDQFYAASPAGVTTVPFPISMVRPSGGNQPHDNTAPTLTLQYCIATTGIFPTQS